MPATGGGEESETAYSSNEIIAKGQKLYDDTLKSSLEPQFDGKILALDIETGADAMGEDTLIALDTLKKNDPDATVYLLRIGHATAITL